MRSIALQVVRKPENGHDILKHNYVQMRALTAVASAKAGVRVQKPLRIGHVSRSKSKNHDKFITPTDRVITSALLLVNSHVEYNLSFLSILRK
jgi:hypothetical protein